MGGYIRRFHHLILCAFLCGLTVNGVDTFYGTNSYTTAVSLHNKLLIAWFRLFSVAYYCKLHHRHAHNRLAHDQPHNRQAPMLPTYLTKILRPLLQGGDLPKIPGGTAIAYWVENALKSPKQPLKTLKSPYLRWK